MLFSLIIPIFNRPDEIDELLESLSKQTYTANYEIVIIEDGSSITCEHIIQKYNCNLLWFNARETAVDFYKKMGYTVIGESFIINDIGTHFVMYKKLI